MTEYQTTDAESDAPFADFDDVEYEETTYVHEKADYCARDTDGRVVVGVTNDDGEVLLLINDEREHAILPNCHVEAGDWRGVARDTVEESTGVAVDLVVPELVRVVDHRIEGEDAPRERTYHVVFAATPAGGRSAPEPNCSDPDWSAGWYDEIPVDIDEDTGDALADMNRFLG